jgi:hypothetical protein
MGVWRDTLERPLTVIAGQPVRERLTLKRLFDELRGFGCNDSCRAACAGLGKMRDHAATDSSVPLLLATGKAYLRDWTLEVVTIKGATVVTRIVHDRLCTTQILANLL